MCVWLLCIVLPVGCSVEYFIRYDNVMSFILVQITLCLVEYFISENYLANIHVANVAYVTTTIYKFKTCKNSYNSQSCKLSALESIKNTWT